MVNNKQEQLMTVKQVAQELSVSEVTIRKWIREGYHGKKLKVRRFGRCVRISREALQQFSEGAVTGTVNETDNYTRAILESRGIKLA